MVRNLVNRVEVAFPVEDKDLAARLKDDLDAYLADNCQSWELQADGSYVQNQPGPDKDRYVSQQVLLDRLTGKTG